MFQGGLWGIELLDANYQVETYASYSPGCWPFVGEMEFDSSGNLYLSYLYGDKIDRIAPGGVVTNDWAVGLDSPRGMAWGGGTPFGNSLYVAEADMDRITKIAPDGTFAGFSTSALTWGPDALALDRTGSYGGGLFAITRASDKTYHVNQSGGVSIFSSWPGNITNGAMAMEFDTGTKYGGGLYIASDSEVVPDKSGLFLMSTTGGVTKFTNNIVSASQVFFDAPNGIFGGDMLVVGYRTWDEDHILCRVDTDGSLTTLAQQTTDQSAFASAIGPDGALYVHEFDSGISTIHRVTPIPEPMTVSLMLFGGLGLLAKRRNRSL